MFYRRDGRTVRVAVCHFDYSPRSELAMFYSRANRTVPCVRFGFGKQGEGRAFYPGGGVNHGGEQVTSLLNRYD